MFQIIQNLNIKLFILFYFILFYFILETDKTSDTVSEKKPEEKVEVDAEGFVIRKDTQVGWADTNNKTAKDSDSDDDDQPA